MSGSNGTGVVAAAAPDSGAPPSQFDHWAYQVDTPFRAPAEIKELAGGSGPAAADEALGEGSGAAWSEAEDPFLEASEQADVGLEAWEEAETEGVDGYEAEAAAASADLLEETPAGEHPLAAVFSLPRIAFDAMAKGGWATAIAMAIGAGVRDVNRLTNMVFWFRHPSLIGQKLRSDQRDLAREWVDIRDSIVKPALAGATVGSSTTATPTAPPVVATSTSGGGPVPTTTIDGKQAIPPDGLRWWGKGPGSPELLDFMRRVYRLHVKRSSGDFINTLPESQVDTIEGKHRAQKDAAARAREMLAAARADLAREGLATTYRIGITSAYRSASEQFDIWQGKGGEGRRGFPNYYRESAGARQALGDPHGDKAAAHLAKYLGKYIAAPGYSNHQDGLALDLGTGLAAKGGLGKIGEKAWFHKWLVRRAHEFKFKPYEAEAWHWVYYGPRTGSQSETWEAGETWPASEAETSEAATSAIRAGRLEVANVPLLASHRGKPPDVVLRWNDMPSMPAEIDVVVHLHGYSWASMTLPKHMEVWSGLDLAPVDGASGSGRSRPTLTVLPRGHFTGEQRGRIYKYTFPALTTRDGLTRLISVSLERFAGQVGGAAPKVGRLILTAHSGGGAPLMTILRHHDPNEVHVFDGLYQDASSLAAWASRHLRADRAAVESGAAPTGAMRVFYGRSTRTFSHRLFDALKADLRSAPASLADRYRIESSSLGHFQIPRQYGWRVLTDAAADVPEARRLPLRKGPAPRREDESESEWEGESATADEELEMEDGLESEAATGAFEGTEFEEPEADGEAIFEVEDEAEDEGEAFDVGEAESEDHEATDHEASDHDVAPEGLEEETEFEDLGDFQAAGMSSPVAGAGSQPEAPDGVRSAVALLDLAPDQEHPALTAVRQLMAFQFGPDLQQGSTGVAVTALQNGLTTLGHQVTATGTFGQDTVNAVRAFQRARGLCPSGIVRTQTKVEMVRALTRRNNAGFDPLPEAIVRVARNQLQRWQVNGVFIRETDKAASPILIEYYRDGLCPRQPPTDKEVQDDVWHCGNPWSAAFVSWVMRSAGAGRDFNYSAAHVDYVRDARRNRCNNVAANPFWAYRATEVAPELGDLVCRSRHRRPADATTYENVMQGGARPLHCDIVTTAAQGGRIMVTGGNVAIPQPGASQIHGQTVAQRPLRVDAAGMLDLTGDQSRIFAVIRCRGRAPGVPQPC